MNKLVTSLLAVGVAVFFVACEYDAPLATDPNLPIDPAILGTWIAQSDGDSSEAVPERLVILKFSATDYVVHHQPTDSLSAYYRGYPIRVGDVACVQLEALGSAEGAATQPTRYLVATYQISEAGLAVRILNDDVVSTNLSGTAAIRAAFLEHAADPKLFREPGIFIRPAKPSEAAKPPGD